MESTPPPRRPKLDECRGLIAGSLGDGYGSLPDAAPVVHIKLPRQGAQRYHGLRNVTLLSFAVFGIVSIKLPSRHLKSVETDVDTTVLVPEFNVINATSMPVRSDENSSTTATRADTDSSSGRVRDAAVAAWQADANASGSSAQNRSRTMPKKAKKGGNADVDGRKSNDDDKKTDDKMEAKKGGDDDGKAKDDDGKSRETLADDDGELAAKLKYSEEEANTETVQFVEKRRESNDDDKKTDDKMEAKRGGDDDGKAKDDDGKSRETLADDDGELAAKLKYPEEEANTETLQHEQQRRDEAERALEQGEAERVLEESQQSLE